jgi:hypothetical protein
MASPRRLKEVFMITGTLVRLPNSSMRRDSSGISALSFPFAYAGNSESLATGSNRRILNPAQHKRSDFRARYTTLNLIYTFKYYPAQIIF